MNKTRIILRNELKTILQSRSYLFTLIGLPVIMALVLVIVGLITKNQQAVTIPGTTPTSGGPAKIFALIDRSGVIKTIPDTIANKVVAYTDLDAARADTVAGKLAGIYVFEQDFLENGSLSFYPASSTPSFSENTPEFLKTVVQANLLPADPALLARVDNPMNVKTILPPALAAGAPQGDLAFIIPYVITILFYIILISVSTTMFNSITKEKENRVMEILLTSASPMQLLTAKIIARGITGLLQVVVWFITGTVMLRIAGQAFSIPTGAGVPVGLVIWAIVFFILGYAIYASLMAGLGAMVPNLQEGSQTTFAVIFPLIIPLMFMNNLTVAPNSGLSIALSMVPFTSPVAMVARIASGQTPLWQILVSVLILVITTYLVVKASARMFRADNLVSGRSIKATTFYKELFGRQN